MIVSLSEGQVTFPATLQVTSSHNSLLAIQGELQFEQFSQLGNLLG